MEDQNKDISKGVHKNKPIIIIIFLLDWTHKNIVN